MTNHKGAGVAIQLLEIELFYIIESRRFSLRNLVYKNRNLCIYNIKGDEQFI